MIEDFKTKNIPFESLNFDKKWVRYGDLKLREISRKNLHLVFLIWKMRGRGVFKRENVRESEVERSGPQQATTTMPP